MQHRGPLKPYPPPQTTDYDFNYTPNVASRSLDVLIDVGGQFEEIVTRPARLDPSVDWAVRLTYKQTGVRWSLLALFLRRLCCCACAPTTAVTAIGRRARSRAGIFAPLRAFFVSVLRSSFGFYSLPFRSSRVEREYLRFLYHKEYFPTIFVFATACIMMAINTIIVEYDLGDRAVLVVCLVGIVACIMMWTALLLLYSSPLFTSSPTHVYMVSFAYDIGCFVASTLLTSMALFLAGGDRWRCLAVWDETVVNAEEISAYATAHYDVPLTSSPPFTSRNVSGPTFAPNTTSLGNCSAQAEWHHAAYARRLFCESQVAWLSVAAFLIIPMLNGPRFHFMPLMLVVNTGAYVAGVWHVGRLGGGVSPHDFDYGDNGQRGSFFQSTTSVAPNITAGECYIGGYLPRASAEHVAHSTSRNTVLLTPTLTSLDLRADLYLLLVALLITLYRYGAESSNRTQFRLFAFANDQLRRTRRQRNILRRDIDQLVPKPMRRRLLEAAIPVRHGGADGSVSSRGARSSRGASSVHATSEVAEALRSLGGAVVGDDASALAVSLSRISQSAAVSHGPTARLGALSIGPRTDFSQCCTCAKLEVVHPEALFAATASIDQSLKILVFIRRHIIQLCEVAGVQRVAAHGDSFCVVSNMLPHGDDGEDEAMGDFRVDPAVHHALLISRFAVAAVTQIRNMADVLTTNKGQQRVQMRAGVHTGVLYGGVTGDTHVTYGLYGDSFNGARALSLIAGPSEVVASSDVARMAGPQLVTFPLDRTVPIPRASVPTAEEGRGCAKGKTLITALLAMEATIDDGMMGATIDGGLLGGGDFEVPPLPPNPLLGPLPLPLFGFGLTTLPFIRVRKLRDVVAATPVEEILERAAADALLAKRSAAALHASAIDMTLVGEAETAVGEAAAAQRGGGFADSSAHGIAARRVPNDHAASSPSYSYSGVEAATSSHVPISPAAATPRGGAAANSDRDVTTAALARVVPVASLMPGSESGGLSLPATTPVPRGDSMSISTANPILFQGEVSAPMGLHPAGPRGGGLLHPPSRSHSPRGAPLGNASVTTPAVVNPLSGIGNNASTSLSVTVAAAARAEAEAAASTKALRKESNDGEARRERRKRRERRHKVDATSSHASATKDVLLAIHKRCGRYYVLAFFEYLRDRVLERQFQSSRWRLSMEQSFLPAVTPILLSLITWLTTVVAVPVDEVLPLPNVTEEDRNGDYIYFDSNDPPLRLDRSLSAPAILFMVATGCSLLFALVAVAFGHRNRGHHTTVTLIGAALCLGGNICAVVGAAIVRGRGPIAYASHVVAMGCIVGLGQAPFSSVLNCFMVLCCFVGHTIADRIDGGPLQWHALVCVFILGLQSFMTCEWRQREQRSAYVDSLLAAAAFDMAERDARQNAAVLRAAVPAPLQRQVVGVIGGVRRDGAGGDALSVARGLSSSRDRQPRGDVVDVCVYSGAIVIALRFDNVLAEVARRAALTGSVGTAAASGSVGVDHGLSPMVVVQSILGDLEQSVEHVARWYFSLVGSSVCEILSKSGPFPSVGDAADSDELAALLREGADPTAPPERSQARALLSLFTSSSQLRPMGGAAVKQSELIPRDVASTSRNGGALPPTAFSQKSFDSGAGGIGVPDASPRLTPQVSPSAASRQKRAANTTRRFPTSDVLPEVLAASAVDAPLSLFRVFGDTAYVCGPLGRTACGPIEGGGLVRESCAMAGMYLLLRFLASVKESAPSVRVACGVAGGYLMSAISKGHLPSCEVYGGPLVTAKAILRAGAGDDVLGGDATAAPSGVSSAAGLPLNRVNTFNNIVNMTADCVDAALRGKTRWAERLQRGARLEDGWPVAAASEDEASYRSQLRVLAVARQQEAATELERLRRRCVGDAPRVVMLPEGQAAVVPVHFVLDRCPPSLGGVTSHTHNTDLASEQAPPSAPTPPVVRPPTTNTAGSGSERAEVGAVEANIQNTASPRPVEDSLQRSANAANAPTPAATVKQSTEPAAIAPMPPKIASPPPPRATASSASANGSSSTTSSCADSSSFFSSANSSPARDRRSGRPPAAVAAEVSPQTEAPAAEQKSRISMAMGPFPPISGAAGFRRRFQTAEVPSGDAVNAVAPTTSTFDLVPPTVSEGGAPNNGFVRRRTVSGAEQQTSGLFSPSQVAGGRFVDFVNM